MPSLRHGTGHKGEHQGPRSRGCYLQESGNAPSLNTIPFVLACMEPQDLLGQVV